MSAQPVEPDRLDPDRPFARLMRGLGQEIVLYDEDIPQWIEDWLAYCGLTADELMAKHDANDFDSFREREAWASIGPYLQEARDGRPLRPSA